MRVPFFSIATLFIAFFACCKDIETSSETTVLHDTIRVIDTLFIDEMVNDTVTTFILVRHAEKDTIGGSNPNLNAMGVQRAETLKQILLQVGIQNIYSTNYNRTKQTALPLANALSKSIIEYNEATPIANLTKQLLADNKNKVALVVGHSNTIPELLKEFSNNVFITQIHDSVYNNLYIVTIPFAQSARVVHLKYGN